MTIQVCFTLYTSVQTVQTHTKENVEVRLGVEFTLTPQTTHVASEKEGHYNLTYPVYMTTLHLGHSEIKRSTKTTKSLDSRQSTCQVQWFCLPCNNAVDRLIVCLKIFYLAISKNSKIFKKQWEQYYSFDNIGHLFELNLSEHE